jgi:Asp-tRNA(Asn)/Glu-tRNA(Gln) amidotransferase A subunit family amidase
VPRGLSSDGLPIGLQIAGPVFSDAGVLALAAEAEEMCTHDFSQPVMPELP